MKVYTYRTDSGKDLIEGYLKSIPDRERAESAAILNGLTDIGLDALTELNTRQIDGKLWEIKFRRHNRLFYIIIGTEALYIVHACKKQKGKAEKKDIDKAKDRANRWEAGNAI